MDEPIVIKVDRDKGHLYINGQLIDTDCDTPQKVAKAVDNWMLNVHPIHF